MKGVWLFVLRSGSLEEGIIAGAVVNRRCGRRPGVPFSMWVTCIHCGLLAYCE